MIINEKERRHDYFENVQNYGGIDKTIVYNREYRKIEVKPSIANLPNFTFLPDKKESWDRFVNIETNLLAFCGKLYPVFRYRLRTGPFSVDKKFFHHSPEFAKNIEFSKRRYKNSLKEMESWFSENNKKSTNINLEYKSPTILIGDMGYKLLIDPMLKDLEFYKIMDPFTTFQEIEMWIGSVLCMEKQPSPDNVPDKYKVEQKGFDKFSFRKPKQEK